MYIHTHISIHVHIHMCTRMSQSVTLSQTDIHTCTVQPLLSKTAWDPKCSDNRVLIIDLKLTYFLIFSKKN